MLVATRDDAGPLLGRETETKLLTSLLDAIHSGGTALVLRGEPGIGKSRLLAEAAAVARDRDIAVLSTTGVQSEAHPAPWSWDWGLIARSNAQTRRPSNSPTRARRSFSRRANGAR
jgi:hypothetical protein